MGKEKEKRRAQQPELDTHSSICTTLNSFRNEGGAWQSQLNAGRLLMELKEKLPDDEYRKLTVAHNHYLTGEGAEELYEVCTELSKKYCVYKNI